MTTATLLPLIAAGDLGNRTFDYHIPAAWVDRIAPGTLVRMPLGHQDNVVGLVMEVTPSVVPGLGDGAHLKAIDSVAFGGEPVCNPSQLALWRWMAHYYGSTLAEAALCALPGTLMTPRHFATEPPENGLASAYIRPLWVTHCLKSLPPTLTLSRRQQEIWQEFQRLQDGGHLPLAEEAAIAHLKTTRKGLHALAVLGVLSLEVVVQPPALQPSDRRWSLNPDQRNAIAAVQASPGVQESPWLLHGVTGSGKTEVYLDLAEAAWQAGQGVWILVPEIALTGPIGQRFLNRFGREAVALWHSRLNDKERLRTWFRLLHGDCRMIVGARSAILAPLQNPGLLIIDEAHDDSLKQDAPAPRYDARTVARWLADFEQMQLVLGSATPTISQYHEALTHRDHLLTLPNRALGQTLPEVITVDMRQERAAGYVETISRPLRQALLETVARDEQAIILLNRRGYNTLLNCGHCGHIFECPNCSVSVIFHQSSRVVRCHHCGWQGEVPTFCPECASLQIQRLGTGTQRLSEEVAQLLRPAEEKGPVDPLASGVLRLDSDIIARDGSAMDVLNAFRRGEGQVLVGTQIVAKGLDIPKVTLVGVVQADGSFYMPEYKSHERGFQLLTQVAGRAGRGDKPGTVYLQTWQPEHAVIQFARRQDFEGFYQWEIEQRREYQFPPFTQLVRLIISDEEEARASQYCKALTNVLRQELAASLPSDLVEQVTIWGPSASMIPRVQNRYRFHLLLKLTGDEAHRTLLREQIVAFYRELKIPKGLRVLLDVDAESLL